MIQAERSLFVFISYSRADKELVDRLRRDLYTHGISAWIDQESIQPGTPDWEEALRSAVRSSNAVLLIASPRARSSRYVKDELRIAEMYRRPIYPVWVAGDQWMEAIPIGWGSTQYIDARADNYTQAIQAIVRSVYQSANSLAAVTPEPVTPAPSTFEPRNPYKGLRAFTSADAHDFFGRSALVDELMHALQMTLQEEAWTTQQVRPVRLLSVVGPSGSGKSSAVMAGLLPKLQMGALTESQEWIYLSPVVPGAHPLEALTLALAEKLSGRSLTSIREDLNDDSARGLHLLGCSLLPKPRSHMVLLVDQFEELFTQTIDEAERRHFIDLLVAAMTEPQGPIIVIVTLRADFDDRPMRYPDLGQLLERHRVPLLPMELEDLRAIIEKPAALPDVLLSFEGDLVGDLLFEVQGQTGALPLLQFTLEQLFQRRSGHLLTLQAYHDLGGVKGALASHAEDVYNSLPTQEHHDLARDLFLRLIDPGMTEQDTTRRRAALAELTLPDPRQSALFQEIATTFVAARLLTTSTRAGVATIEVSHEALIREWPRLAEWLRTNRNDLLLQKSISMDALEWIKYGQPDDRLYRGTQLDEARTWAKRSRPSANEIHFLEASVDAQEREVTAERARQTQERSVQIHAQKRLHYARIMTGITFILLIAVLLGALHIQDQQLKSRPVAVTKPDDHGEGSLRNAIAIAPPGSAITFAKDLGTTIVLTTGPLQINKNLTISGPGPDPSHLVISGGDSSVFKITHAGTVTLSNLTISHGHGSLNLYKTPGEKIGGGINNSGTLAIVHSVIADNTAVSGAGISNLGTLTITNSELKRNRSSKGGGAIDNLGTLTITNSTIADNMATTGGGIQNEGKLIMHNNTIVSNTATQGDGGGILNQPAVTADMVNNTITANRAQRSGGGISNSGVTRTVYSTIYGNQAVVGGGVASVKDSSSSAELGMTVENSIIAGNIADKGPDASGTITLLNPNLIQHVPDPTLHLVYGGDPQSKEHRLAGKSIFGQSPKLGGLNNNGGPTQTMELAADSPAIDLIPDNEPTCGDRSAIIISHISYSYDQRGKVRGTGRGCDLGAYERSLPNIRNPYFPYTGSLVIDDQLSSRDHSAWSEYEYTRFVENAYRIKSVEHGIQGVSAGIALKDFSFQVDMTILQGDAGGVAFRLASTRLQQYYVFGISRRGTYTFRLNNGFKDSDVLKKGRSSAIHSGLNQRNVLAVVAQGQTFDLYVNHVHIDTIKNDVLAQGFFGLVAIIDTPNLTEIAFKNARVWSLSEAE
ncbi:nSTAND1 domain-containing NTPase [Dictyobacter aurantiacus]|uniref:TIR domain-containing protein n=1 Tax=Dictyobacter aurantiacus TaxID=1936993 RepID=A0A401ZIY1_9CHLR|nr:TIR domain-containing protein [Dictyobacter aurantiacus]GCE06803.1 hypothetical protein KDAU_41320 [Dictyobacter aurantiacus]